MEEGPERVHELERLGTKFDRDAGRLILGSEGAHSVPRVVHAGGDATGSVVASALAEALSSGGRAQLHENEFVIDLLTDGGHCVGAVSLGREGELTVSLARAVVLACGGAGQVFSNTTNPLMATGDGHAMAYRAGAVMRDREFMQFHPTAFYATENPTLLVTEALRGEGAYLVDKNGERFMLGAIPGRSWPRATWSSDISRGSWTGTASTMCGSTPVISTAHSCGNASPRSIPAWTAGVSTCARSSSPSLPLLTTSSAVS